MDFAMGPQSGQGVPAEIDNRQLLPPRFNVRTLITSLAGLAYLSMLIFPYRDIN